MSDGKRARASDFGLPGVLDRLPLFVFTSGEPATRDEAAETGKIFRVKDADDLTLKISERLRPPPPPSAPRK